MTPLRICAFRPRPRGARLLLQTNNAGTITRRSFAAEKNNPGKLPKAPEGEAGPNTNQQEHISVEAAKMAEIQGKEGPDLEQGTPVEEIFKDEKDMRQQAPEALKQQVQDGKTSSSPSGTRSFSTSARRRNLEVQPPPGPPMDALLSTMPSALPNASSPTPYASSSTPASTKFASPDYSSIKDKSSRHEPIITQLTNLLMRDGKKSVAERNMSVILNTLRTAPAPTYSPTRPLLPGAPPASHLPLNPILYLTLAVDSVAPLMRMRSQRGAAGGGVALQIPVPLGLRQRRRTSFMWIVDAASKRQNRGSGRDTFAVRVAQELVSVVEGKSGVWEKRNAVHRLATAGRTNVAWRLPGFRR